MCNILHVLTSHVSLSCATISSFKPCHTSSLVSSSWCHVTIMPHVIIWIVPHITIIIPNDHTKSLKYVTHVTLLYSNVSRVTSLTVLFVPSFLIVLPRMPFFSLHFQGIVVLMYYSIVTHVTNLYNIYMKTTLYENSHIITTPFGNIVLEWRGSIVHHILWSNWK